MVSTDYVQQYNVASVRPAVQQTYRGTPPPARRPVDNYSPRPVPVSHNDYDDELIQGQVLTIIENTLFNNSLYLGNFKNT